MIAGSRGARLLAVTSRARGAAHRLDVRRAAGKPGLAFVRPDNALGRDASKTPAARRGRCSHLTTVSSGCAVRLFLLTSGAAAGLEASVLAVERVCTLKDRPVQGAGVRCPVGPAREGLLLAGRDVQGARRRPEGSASMRTARHAARTECSAPRGGSSLKTVRARSRCPPRARKSATTCPVDHAGQSPWSWPSPCCPTHPRPNK